MNAADGSKGESGSNKRSSDGADSDNDGDSLTCRWCGKTAGNRGALANHIKNCPVQKQVQTKLLLYILSDRVAVSLCAIIYLCKWVGGS